MEIVDRQNPWWFIKNWEEKDRYLNEWRMQKIKWIPRWLNEVSYTPFSLNFVYGARQVGKSTGLKLLIKMLIDRGVNPNAVFYIDLDVIISLFEFRNIMSYIIKEKRRRNIKTAYIILDEVTSVENWWKIIKYYIDIGDVANDVIIVSGSSTIGIIKTPERFPGRYGYGKVIKVLPLSFPEFIKIMNFSEEEALYRSDILSDLWEKYREKGGFPKSINDHFDAKDVLIHAMLSEIYKHGKDTRTVQDIIASLIPKLPSALSYNSIAQDIGISHNTVREYIEFLSDLLLLGIAYLKRNSEVVVRREKKIFIRDPFLSHTLSTWVSKKLLESAIFENIVQEHVYRKFGEIYYFKNTYEIDIIASNLKIEVKAGKPHRRYLKNVIVLDEYEIPKFLLKIYKENSL